MESTMYLSDLLASLRRIKDDMFLTDEDKINLLESMEYSIKELKDTITPKEKR